MRVSERRGKESASESWPPRPARPILALFAALLVTLTAAPSTDASSAGAFIKAYGWGVSDGASSFETCTATCQEGIGGGGAGQLLSPEGIAAIPRATSTSPTRPTTGSTSSPRSAPSSRPTAGASATAPAPARPAPAAARPGSRGAAPALRRPPASPSSIGQRLRRRPIQQPDRRVLPAGAFIRAYGWGVSDGASSFKTCTATCQEGIGGGGPGPVSSLPEGVAPILGRRLRCRLRQQPDRRVLLSRRLHQGLWPRRQQRGRRF